VAKIIFTADDYGCADIVDEGIVTAVDNNWINSVAAFGNGPGAMDRLERIASYQNSRNLEIGCHLTITSGKSKNGISSFTDDNCNFREFVKLSPSKMADAKKELKEELLAQMSVLKDKAGLEIKHLSSHHNSLVFFPEYLETLIEIAMDYDPPLPIRAPIIKPTFKNKLFIAQLQFRSLTNLDPLDITGLKVFSDHIRLWLRWYDKKKGGLPKMPGAIDGRHYGPLPPFKPKEKTFDVKAERKARKLARAIGKLSDDESVEYCFHLMKDDYNASINYKDSDYKGVDPKYFDSRVIEFRSLKHLQTNNKQQLTSWSNI